jgi:uncharacterized protein (TIRG00374 family)
MPGVTASENRDIPPHAMMKHRWTVIAVGLGASAVFVYLAVRGLDLGAVRESFHHAELLPWVPLGVLSYLVGHVVRGMRCRLLVRREASLSLPTASNIVVVGYASNNVLPARLGELVRAGMLAERTGMPMVQSLAVTFIERVLDGLAILFLLVLTTVTGDTPGWIQDIVRVALIVFGAATLVMFGGAYAPGAILGVASRVGNRLGHRWHDRVVSLATSITNAGACLRDPRTTILLAISSVVVWTLEAGLFVALLPVFGIEATPQDGVLAMCVTNLGLLVPSSPGFIGPFHYFASRAIMVHGVPEATALAYATLVHLAFYIPVTIWGTAAMLWYGVEVGSTAAIAREARKGGKRETVRGVQAVVVAQLTPEPAAPPASAFTVGLLEAIAVAPGRTPEPAGIQYAATFVEGQIAALQPKLRILYNIGMTGFRFVTRLRFLRGYCNIPLEARRVWTLRWAEGRIALLRQLFKPVRAIGLLAYYDHESVRGPLLAEHPMPAASLVRPRPEPSGAPAEAAEPRPAESAP